MSYNKILDRDLQQLKSDIEQMIEETKIQYAETFEVVKTGDVNLALMVIEHDRIINDMQNEFTSTALWKIAKQNMVAKDLRLAVGAILISREIERIADYSKNVCRFFVNYKPTKKYINSIIKMFQIVIDMLDIISRLFVEYAVDNKESVLDLEHELDKEFKSVYDYLIKQIRKTETHEEAVEIAEAMKQVKNLERAGDHLFNVQEIVTFIRTGKFEEVIDTQEKLEEEMMEMTI
ncbi:phosphate signaling complex protein PhoU [[Acholeplasma] multilocale]|uniref:phosphate signaling complex protein PhoU n=1 Tax=[Acholeplasma] multilocale TaxID=264638 RepID=UPI00047C79D2|nr:phosphate signaling complex protein PhoU [[Acholeplasma] multilocale]